MQFKGEATAIGSLPYLDPEKACQVVMENFPAIPAWPQLPRLNLRENMYIQATEGMPCIVLDESRGRVYFDTDRDTVSELEMFYQRIMENRVDDFKITSEYAKGFYFFLEYLRTNLSSEQRRRILAVKGQLIGPVSFGLTITDQNRRPIIYNEQLMEAVVRVCAMKARWQIRKMKEVFPQVILFIDEPYLSSFGSAFVSLSREEIIEYLNLVFQAVKSEGGISGVHCCGNTDWSILLDTEVEILSFDAYNYLETVSLYPDHLKKFLTRAGSLAWGIVPAASGVWAEDVSSLVEKFSMALILLERKGIGKEDILRSFLITPSCGTGTLPVEVAERVVGLTGEVAHAIKEMYFGN